MRITKKTTVEDVFKELKLKENTTYLINVMTYWRNSNL